jgi:ferritin
MSDFTTYKNFKSVKELNDDIPDEIENMDVPVIVDETPVVIGEKPESSIEPISFSDLPINPKTLNDISEKISLHLNERIGDEYKAYFFYRNAANWCKGANYNKAAEFFEAEAANELIHSKGVQDYLTQWNLLPSIPPAPTTISFTGLVDVINKAYEMEYELLEKYSADQKVFFDLHPATFNFIQKYVDIQNAEVSEYSDLLNALVLINPNNKLDILFFEKNYFEVEG